MCKDYSVDYLTVSCPNLTAGWGASAIECQVQPTLGISEPYPCPCSIPQGYVVSYGRGVIDLYEVAKERDTQGLTWRYMELYSGQRLQPQYVIPGPDRTDIGASAQAWNTSQGAAETQESLKEKQRLESIFNYRRSVEALQKVLACKYFTDPFSS